LAASVAADDLTDLRVPEASVAVLPAVADRAGKVLGFDAGGDPTMVEVAGATDPSLRTDLAASSGASLVGYLPAGVGAVATTLQQKNQESVSLWDFMTPAAIAAQKLAATDVTAAFQAAVDSLPSWPNGAATIVFPYTGNNYLVTDTVHCGRFSLAGNNVQGFSKSKRGLTLDLQGSILQWDGPDQPGSTKVVKTDTVGNYNLITDDKPVISVVACDGFSIRNGIINGLSPNGLKQAFSAIWFQGNHNKHTFDNFTTFGARVGVRHGCSWDLVGGVQYWGYADSPYYKANVYNAPAVGGWQGDTQSLTACSLAGTLAHYTTESAQNLSISMNAVNMGEGVASATYGVVMVGGRITGNGVSVNKASQYDFWMPTGSNSLTMTDLHSESAALVKIQTSTVATVPKITLTNADSAVITLAGGGGDVTLIGCAGVKLVRNDVNAKASITVINSNIAGLAVANTGIRDNVNIKLINCEATAALLDGATANNCFVSAENCTNMSNLPAQAGTFSTANETFNGQSHHIRGKLALPHNVATLAGTIATSKVGNSSMGSCLLRANFSTGASNNMAGVVGQYQFAWTRDSGGVVTVSAVSVVSESKAFDTFTSFDPAITAVVNGANVELWIRHVNNFTVGAGVEYEANVYVGGYYAVARVPVWTAA
jgi:hypothetical protein